MGYQTFHLVADSVLFRCFVSVGENMELTNWYIFLKRMLVSGEMTAE